MRRESFVKVRWTLAGDVSIDPDRDTPNRLQEFASGAHLDAARYTLLRGGDADLLDLAAALGVRYRKVAPDQFVHSNTILVVDENGSVVHRQDETGTVAETIAALK